MVAGAKFFLASLGISCDTHQICVVRSGKVREKCAEKVRESQGIQIKVTGGNPDFSYVSRGQFSNVNTILEFIATLSKKLLSDV